MSLPLTCIVERQTLDWAAMDETTYRELSVPFCRLWGRPDDYMANLVALWNRTFGMDYFQVRAAQKQLARTHNQGLTGTRYLPWNGYRDIPSDGFAYVFVDDDDWLAPGLATALQTSALASHEAGIWKGCTLGSPKSEHVLFFWGLNGRCMTNNYAVTPNGLARHSLPQLAQHGLAEQTVPGMDTLLLDHWLSITNKSPASSVSLEQALGQSRDPRLLAKAVERYNRRMDSLCDSDFDRAPWAWPLCEATRTLFRAVEASQAG